MNRLDIWNAVAKGSVEEVEKNLNSGVSVNIRNQFLQTPLHKASLFGKDRVIEYLISKKADVNAEDEMGNSPLQNAISSSNEIAVEILLQAKADIALRDGDGNTPLSNAQNRLMISDPVKRQKILNLLKGHRSFVEEKEAENKQEKALDELTPPPSPPPERRPHRASFGKSHTPTGKATSKMVDDEEGRTHRKYSQLESTQETSSPREPSKPKRYIAVSLLGDKADRARDDVYDFTTKKWIDEEAVNFLSETYDMIELSIDEQKKSYFYYDRSDLKVYVKP